ncbi:MAG: cation diffusion facilitator family transporter [Bacteroidales bacterium]|nr:cation diffusion facilitator family transporter [Bacteroidales bacterium]
MDKRAQKIERVTLGGAVCNVALCVGKLMAGFIGGSSAMVADAVHSFSDLVSDIIVIIFTRITAKEKDCRHEYGHGRFETLASLAVSLLLIVAGAIMLTEAVEDIYYIMKGVEGERPGYIALAAAVISILVKELLYQWTKRVGTQLNSSVMIANAWHHRSDALSSVGSVIGIGGAILMGGKWIMLDPLTGAVISVIIIIVGVRMSLPAINELTDASLSDETEAEILAMLAGTEGVLGVHELKTRSCGHYYAIEAHIVVNPDITVAEAHDITVHAEKALRSTYGGQTQISIHVEPNDTAE